MWKFQVYLQRSCNSLLFLVTPGGVSVLRTAQREQIQGQTTQVQKEHKQQSCVNTALQARPEGCRYHVGVPWNPFAQEHQIFLALFSSDCQAGESAVSHGEPVLSQRRAAESQQPHWASPASSCSQKLVGMQEFGKASHEEGCGDDSSAGHPLAQAVTRHCSMQQPLNLWVLSTGQAESRLGLGKELFLF